MQIEEFLGRRSVALALAALLALLYLVHAGTSSIWDSNEAFYVETPREMMEHGTHLVPTFNYQLRLNKPPLAYWLVMIGYRLGGVSVWSQRLVIAFFALATLVVVWRFAFDVSASRAVAWAAAGITALTPRIFVMARRSAIDMVLLFFVTAAIYFFYRYVEERRPSSLVWLGVCLGFGFMGKGPVAVALPILVGAAYLLWRRELPRPPAWAVLAGAGVFLLVVLPWYVGLARTLGLDAIYRLLVVENLGRFTVEDFGPQRGPFYYLPIFLADFAPWSLLVVAGAFLLRRVWAGSDGRDRSRIVFLLIWIVLPVLFFSVSKNKQEYYILPSYPPAALLLAWLGRRLADAAEPRRLAVWALRGVFVLGLGIAGLAYVVGRQLLDRHVLLTVALVVMTGLMAVGWIWAGGRRWRAAMAVPVVGVYVACLFLAYEVIPALEKYRPVPELAAMINERIRPGEQAGYFATALPSLCFYTRRPILELFSNDVLAHFFRSPETFYCLMRKEHLAVLDRAGVSYQVLAERPFLVIKARDIGDMLPGMYANPLCLVVSRRQGTAGAGNAPAGGPADPGRGPR
jgi:4-amino-4-deoxy-L-arabinose transferase-like glycosyltransferase